MESNFESNFFTLLGFLDPSSRLEVNAVCTKKNFQPQEMIYSQGDPPNSIYVVSSGVVEALTVSPDGHQTRTVGVMGRGDFFGDLAVLTGQPRLAAVRALEPTEVLRIEKLAFINLLEHIPKMGAYFSRNLARRLHKTSTEAHLNIFNVDLSGNLRHFDLLTIFQAITSMGRTGELQINNSGNELIGNFFFREGRAEQARFVHLQGIEAVWEGFVQSCSDGTFNFRAKDTPTVVVPEEHRIVLSSTDLLMQGCTRRDAYHSLPESLREMQGRLGRLTEVLTWTEPDSQVLAEKVWDLIARRPQPLASMWRRLNYSSLSYLEVVSALVTSGQAEWLETPTPDNVIETVTLPTTVLPKFPLPKS
jgi:CRP-like cAMP-binding protein